MYTWYISFSFIEIELNPPINSSNLHIQGYAVSKLENISNFQQKQ